MCEGKMQYDMLCMYICLTYDDYNSCYAQSKSVKDSTYCYPLTNQIFKKNKVKKVFVL